MEKGYYLSTFLVFGELENIYGIKLRHDQAVALWHYDGQRIKLIRYWELERFSGIKEHPVAIFNKDNTVRMIENLLKQEGLGLKDIKAIWGTRGLESDIQYREQFLSQNICFHNIAHLLTAIFYNNKTPFKSNIIGLAVDAGPDSQFEYDAYEKKYYSGCIIKEGKIEIFNMQSPARLWSYSKKRFNMREGTLMALATATNTEYYFDLRDFKQYNDIELLDELSRGDAEKVVEEVIEKVFKITREDINVKCSCFDDRFSDEENKISMVMKIIEKMSEGIISKNIDSIVERYKIDTKEYILAIAGGFALNCPTNSYVIEKYKFLGCQIPPCTSDTGIALGVGIAGFFDVLYNENVELNLDTAYYGMHCGSVDFINEAYSKYIDKIETVSMQEIVNDIIRDKVIVWINGNAEIGPRALGNRSLIGDPRFTETKDLLNKIKQRQWWRPVAPVIMDNHGEKYFENYRYSPYMLLNFKVKQNKKHKVLAIIHEDGTARVQSLKKNDNKELYMLLHTFYLTTNVPILCNTSLNDAGEPIINSINQAIEFALHKGLNAVYLNGKYKISLRKNTEQLGRKFNFREVNYFNIPENKSDIKKYKLQNNPHNLNVEELTYCLDNPNKYSRIDIIEEKGAKKIKNDTKEYLKKYKKALER